MDYSDEEDYRDGLVDSDILSHARTPVTLPTAPLQDTRNTQIMGRDCGIESKLRYVQREVSQNFTKYVSSSADVSTCIITIIPNDQSKLAYIEIHLRVTECWAVIKWCKINQGNQQCECHEMKIETQEQCITEINTLLQECRTTMHANASMMYALDRLTDHLLKIN